MSWSDVFATLEGFGWNYLSTILMAAVVSYLGLFTVMRRIVFTGVALAQVAAAGVGAAFFVADHGGVSRSIARFAGTYGATLGSFVLTLIAAFGVRVRSSRGKVGGDAVIGFLYVTSAALAVLLVWRSSRGLAELREILAGEVLLTSPGELILLAVALLVVGVIHIRARKKFLLVAYDPEFAKTIGIDVARTDLLFLATFATAVAFSLRAGGLLLVFAFLVLPSMIGLTLGRRLRESTVLCFAAALGGSIAGYLIAIVENLPVAHSISAVLGLTFVVARVADVVRWLAPLLRALVMAAGLFGVAVALFLIPSLLANSEWGAWQTVDVHRGHQHGGGPTTDEGPAAVAERLATAIGHLRGGGSSEERIEAAITLGEVGNLDSLPVLLLSLDEEEPLRRAAIGALRSLASQPMILARLHAIARGAEVELAAYAGRALAAIEDPLACGYLVAFLERADAPLLLRDTVITELRAHAGTSFDYDPFAEPADNADAIAQWWDWWETHRPAQ